MKTIKIITTALLFTLCLMACKKTPPTPPSSPAPVAPIVYPPQVYSFLIAGTTPMVGSNPPGCVAYFIVQQRSLTTGTYQTPPIVGPNNVNQNIVPPITLICIDPNNNNMNTFAILMTNGTMTVHVYLNGVYFKDVYLESGNTSANTYCQHYSF